jgi:hypothetical protein
MVRAMTKDIILPEHSCFNKTAGNKIIRGECIWEQKIVILPKRIPQKSCLKKKFTEITKVTADVMVLCRPRWLESPAAKP